MTAVLVVPLVIFRDAARTVSLLLDHGSYSSPEEIPVEQDLQRGIVLYVREVALHESVTEGGSDLAEEEEAQSLVNEVVD